LHNNELAERAKRNCDVANPYQAAWYVRENEMDVGNMQIGED
jgi:hypothetical protein